MKAAIEVLEKELHMLGLWQHPSNDKAKKELEDALSILKQVEANGGTLVPRKKPKWI